MQTQNPNNTDPFDPKQIQRITKVIDRKSFAVLSSVSAAGFPHAAGIVYDSVGTTMYVHTMRTSRKARNVAANRRVGIVIPVRRLPVGPPFTVQFQAEAEVVDMDDPEIRHLVEREALKKTSGHGALEEPDGCYLRIVPNNLIHSYGIGVSAIGVARDPLHNGPRSISLGNDDR